MIQKFVTIFSLMFVFLTAHGQDAKVVSCTQSGLKIELLPTEISGTFKLRTTRKDGYQEISQAMRCLVVVNDNIFLKAECIQSILNLKFIKNPSGFFSITHEMIIPGKPDLKDPTAGSYGNEFECQWINLSEENI